MITAAGRRQAFNETNTTAQHDVGMMVDDDFGRQWVYLKAEVAIEQGEAVKSEMALDTADNLAAAITASTTTFTDTGATFVTNGVLANMYLSIDNDTGEGQLAIIREVTSETVLQVEWLTSDDGTLDTALDTTSDWTIFAPWLAELATVGTVAIAIAQIDVAANAFFWGLRQGVGMVRCDTSVAISANTPLVPGDTAGQLTGVYATQAVDEGGSATYNIVLGKVPCATAVHDNDADGTLIPAVIHCPGGITRPYHLKDQWGYAPALT